jgi:hypothetical protein
MIKDYVIDIKNYNGVLRFDNGTGKGFSDIAYGYGKLYFKGTEQELADYEMELIKRGVKIIGSRENDIVNVLAKEIGIEEPKEQPKLTALEVIEEVEKQLHRLNITGTRYADRFYTVLFAIKDLKKRI